MLITKISDLQSMADRNDRASKICKQKKTGKKRFGNLWVTSSIGEERVVHTGMVDGWFIIRKNLAEAAENLVEWGRRGYGERFEILNSTGIVLQLVSLIISLIVISRNEEILRNVEVQ